MADDGWGGKIPGKVKDKLPVIPDKVVEALERGVDVPIEAMVSGPAREHLEDQLRARKEPIHAEKLTPVGKGDPRIAHYGKVDGTHMPLMPARKRVIPAPFVRPGAVMRQDHGRVWKLVSAGSVRVDDIVVDIGKIVSVELEMEYKLASELVGLPMQPGQDARVAVGDVVILTGLDGIRKAFSPGAQLRAFVLDDTAAAVSP